MNLPHAHSHRAPQPKSYLGVSLVVAIHVAAIYAFSAGLIQSPPKHQEPIAVKPLTDVVDPPRPVEKLQPTEPILPEPHLIQVPVPDNFPIDFRNDQPPPLTGVPLHTDPGPLGATGRTGGEVAPPQTTQKPQVQTPGAVCSVMPKPELPALNWSGEAVLQVLATVRGGRVVGSDFRVAQGALDSKTKRSLQRSVESALAGYQCQGDAVFQQDFAFRLD